MSLQSTSLDYPAVGTRRCKQAKLSQWLCNGRAFLDGLGLFSTDCCYRFGSIVVEEEMSAFLKSRSNGKITEIKPGTVTIGRGPFLEVTEKRVSRKHAELKYLDEKLILIPTHSNPCFYRAAGQDKFDVLPRNVEKELQNGDEVSLLPSDLYYQVVINSSQKKDKNLQGNEGEGRSIDRKQSVKSKVHDSSHPAWALSDIKDTSSVDEPTSSCTSKQSIANEPSSTADTSNSNKQHTERDSPCSNVEDEPFSTEYVPLSKKRKLPSWLADLAPAGSNLSNVATSSKQQPTKKPKASNKATTKPAVTKTKVTDNDNTSSTNVSNKAEVKKQTTVRSTIENDINLDNGISTSVSKNSNKDMQSTKAETHVTRNKANFSDDDEDETPIPKSRKALTRRDTVSDEDGDWNDNRKISKTKNVFVSDESDDMQERRDAAVVKKSVEEEKKGQTTSHQPKARTTSQDSQQRSSITTESEESQKSNKLTKHKSIKKCPYGAKCYRKNPQHLIEYSHPSADGSPNVSDESDDDDLPVCPFGASCYRKNLQHFKEYSHLKKQTAATTTATTRKQTGSRASVRIKAQPKNAKNRKSALDGDSDDDGGINSYDYNDSFIDDDDIDEESSSYGENTTDDPDFNVSDTDEEIGVLLDEAKDFVGQR
ncbi:Aprataxin and PNK-like factor [Trichoplax sp. H2]|nr:Aprataxin and PNK-like factor [Trichoplax sp. H2]|eukprot:RDD42534.1 Aprataxin and PNK-like factor [Trichoplax sp. H2]